MSSPYYQPFDRVICVNAGEGITRTINGEIRKLRQGAEYVIYQYEANVFLDGCPGVRVFLPDGERSDWLYASRFSYPPRPKTNTTNDPNWGLF